MKLFIFFTALLSFSVAQADEWTLHTYSKHVFVKDVNDETFGLGYIWKPYPRDAFSLTTGVIPNNSYNKTSIYGAAVTPWFSDFRAAVGFISGYAVEHNSIVGKTNSAIPLFTIEYKINNSIGVIWTMQAFNLVFHW